MLTVQGSRHRSLSPSSDRLKVVGGVRPAVVHSGDERLMRSDGLACIRQASNSVLLHLTTQLAHFTCRRLEKLQHLRTHLQPITPVVNPLESRGNYSAASNNMKLVHWPLIGGLWNLVQRRGDWAGPQPAQSPPRCTKYNSPSINGQCTNRRTAL